MTFPTIHWDVARTDGFAFIFTVAFLSLELSIFILRPGYEILKQKHPGGAVCPSSEWSNLRCDDRLSVFPFYATDKCAVNSCKNATHPQIDNRISTQLPGASADEHLSRTWSAFGPRAASVSLLL